MIRQMEKKSYLCILYKTIDLPFIIELQQYNYR